MKLIILILVVCAPLLAEYQGQYSVNPDLPTNTINPYDTTPSIQAVPSKLYDSDGNYHGTIGNSYDADSVSNPFGTYGNPYSPDSINSPFGPGHDSLSPGSPYNQYGEGWQIQGGANEEPANE